MSGPSYQPGDRLGTADSRLRYVAEAVRVDPRRRRVSVECDCGKVKTVTLNNITRGLTRSCGCLSSETTAARNMTHGASATQMYNVYRAMRARCSASGHSRYPTYAGVTCCPEWTTFEGFVANQPPGRPYEPGLVLARTADIGNYEPANCRWATKSENSMEQVERFAHRMSDGRFAYEVAAANGIAHSAFLQRICSGWSVEDAATRPPRSGKDTRP